MSDAKVEIKFENSMTANKRNRDFAYLRKNCLAPVTIPGLYPCRDFYQEQPNTILGNVRNIMGSEDDDFKIKIITEEADTTRFYELGEAGESNTALTTSPFRASAFGSDGVYIALTNGKVYRVNHTSSSTTEVGDFGEDWFPELGLWDDLYYWWIDPSMGIYRQLPFGDPVQVLNGEVGGSGLRGADFFGGYMIIFTQVGRDIIVLWWDKADNSFFYRRTKIKNSFFLAGGVVDGRLMLVHFIGNSTNLKELAGEIVVSAWDGENFTRLNSIKAGSPNLSAISSSSARQKTFSTGAEIMEFTVDNNKSDHNVELYDNYIYRIKKDGNIEVRAAPEVTGLTQDRASMVRVFHDFSLYVVNSPYKIYINRDDDEDYDDYDGFTTTEYITNFIGNPYNDHKLDGLSISYEKIFQVDAPPVEPVPGNIGLINAINPMTTTIDLSWTGATSPYFDSDFLEYKVYRSLSNNITTVANMVANGTVVQDWTLALTETATGLSASTTYYFNVIVRDPDGNQTAYVPTSLSTIAAVTAWFSPTANALVEFAATPFATWTNPADAYSANDVFATASQGSQRMVAYYDFDLTVPGGATVVGIQIRVKGKTTADPAGNAKFVLSPTKAAASPTDIATTTATRLTSNITATNAFYTVGHSTDMMGTTWTPAELNAASFGIVVYGSGSSSPVETNFSLDHIEVRIFYTP